MPLPREEKQRMRSWRTWKSTAGAKARFRRSLMTPTWPRPAMEGAKEKAEAKRGAKAEQACNQKAAPALMTKKMSWRFPRRRK